MLTGARWRPTRRSGSGSIDRLAEPDTTARATAWQLAVALTVRCLIARAARGRPHGGRGVRPTAAEGLRYEAEQVQELFEQGEAAEGIRAFIDKRAPEFV